MRRILILLAIILCVPAMAQVDKSELRSGNRKFRKDAFKEAEIDYRRALVKDSTSLKANYNLASTLYRQNNFQGASEVLSKVNNEQAPAPCHYNAGDIALQMKDYATAVKEFRASLLEDPGDIDAKENYIYAKKMLENQQNQQQDQNQDQNQDQDQKDQNQDQNQDQNNDNQDQNQDKDQEQNQQQQESQLSEQQAQQLLNAIRAKERETQEKVEKEKAAKQQSNQKEKNW